MRDAAALAFGTLTAWPVPPPRRIDAGTAGAAMLLAPLTQLPLLALLGLVAAGWLALAGPPLVLAVLLVGGVVVSTRGMHLDGLADTADGLSASFDRTRALAVMKSPDIGPSGVAAVVLALLLQVTSLAALAGAAATAPTPVAGAGPLTLGALALLASRQVLSAACHTRVPPLTDSGLGRTVAGTVSTPRALASAALMLAVGAGAAALGQPWWAGPATVLAGWAGAALTLRHTIRRLGGINGDVLGATMEVCLAAALAAAALVAG